MIAFSPVVVVGLGGIGGHLVEPLARYLHANPDAAPPLLLVDGDAYTRSNQDRQRVTGALVGRNKADAHAEHLRELFPYLSVRVHPEFVDENTVGIAVQSGACVFACVDNHATRKALSDALRGVRDGVLISGGNDVTDGNVQVFWRAEGRNRTAPLDRHHPEIRYPQDVNPSRLTCEQLAVLPSTRQVLMANLTAAALMLNAYHTIVTAGRIPYGEVYFDIQANVATPRPRQ